MNNEPRVEDIEDYNNNETPKKRKIIELVILFLILISVVYGFIKFNYNSVDDYIGTTDKPGINTTKN